MMWTLLIWGPGSHMSFCHFHDIVIYLRQDQEMLLFIYQFSPQCLLYDIEFTEMLKMTNNEQCRIILEPVFYK